jgi:hypothetical protein
MGSKTAERLAIGRLLRSVACLVVLALAAPSVHAQSKNLAPGFESLPKGTRVVVMPLDIELFEISGGGLVEPKADWTDAALKHFRAAFESRKDKLGVTFVGLSEKDADELDEINTLHAAIARSISLHHFGPGFYNLPTKDGKLDWSLGDPVRRIKEKTGADYALFSWVRDSYASGGRIATTIVLAMFGIGLAPGGLQQGYASLVDLNTGQVLWFNRLFRGTGDLREFEKAQETVNALLESFPVPK